MTFADSPVTPASAARAIRFALGTTAMVHGGTWGVLDSADLAEPGTTGTLQLGGWWTAAHFALAAAGLAAQAALGGHPLRDAGTSLGR